jgi:FAD/FMN-containing dehydrogenase
MKVVSNFLSNIPPFFAELARSISGEIDCGERTLSNYSTDDGTYYVRPQAVVYPKHVSDIKQVIIFAREYSLPVTVCGGQSASTGGALSEGIIIDMTRHFNRIRHVNMMEHTVTVDAGVTIAELSSKLLGWNMELPLLEEKDTSGTIGGLVATKSATPTSFHYGTIREWVEGITVAVDTGEEHHIKDGITPSGRLLAIYQAIFPLMAEHGPQLRAAKRENADDASGYSLWETSIGPRQLLDQLVGQDGTLGIITSVTLRVMPKKPYSITTVIALPDTKLLLTTLDSAKHYGADFLFMYDETFATHAEKINPHLITKPQSAPYYLLTSFRGSDQNKLRSQVSSFINTLPFNGEGYIRSDSETKLTIPLPSFLSTMMNSYTKNTYTTIPIATGIITTHEHYSDLLIELEKYLVSSGKLYTITGYAGSYHISISILFDPKSLAYEKDILDITNDIYAIVKKYKAGISATGGDGMARTPYLSFLYNEATFTIFRKVKEVWDPLSIFNPSKKLNVTTDYLYKHTRRI